jgi:hypothetical protein
MVIGYHNKPEFGSMSKSKENKKSFTSADEDYWGDSQSKKNSMRSSQLTNSVSVQDMDNLSNDGSMTTSGDFKKENGLFNDLISANIRALKMQN